MGSTLIFFTDSLSDFTATNGVNISPIPCEHKDGRTGFYLGLDWQTEIESKGVTVELINQNDLVQNADII